MLNKDFGWKRNCAGVAGIVLGCLLAIGGFPLGGGEEAAASPGTSVVWICDQDANTILEVLPLTRNGASQSPLLVYDSAAEQEIINFISQLEPMPSEVRIAETVDFTVPGTFLNAIQSQTGVNTVRLAAADDYVFGSWVSMAGGPRYVVLADEDRYMPYAAVFAHRQSSAFVNSYEEAVRLVRADPDVIGLAYFGTSAGVRADMENLAATYGKAFQLVGSLDEAAVALTPAHMAGTESILTVIHANDNSSTVSSRQYWKLAPIYAALRNTMLVTVDGSTVADIDASLDAKIDSLIAPNNGGSDPDYLVVVGHWMVFPYRFTDSRFPYRLSADARYADRDNDGDYVPEIPFGRMTAYNMGNAALLMNRGPVFDAGGMTRGTKGVFATDWLVDRESETVDALEAMYGAQNVYARGDIEFSNSLVNNPPRTEVLAEAKNAEMVILAGHGNPNYLAATNPAMRGQSIEASRFYPPSFWWFSGCDTGSYYSVGTSLVSGALSSNAVNVWATVDTTATHSSALAWYPGLLAQGKDIGTALQEGLKACEARYGTALNVNKLPQLYLIGDPLVNYGVGDGPAANVPPQVPQVPDGPTWGLAGAELLFTTMTNDPDGDAVTYTFNWGDGQSYTTDWSAGGEVVTVGHAWGEAGLYSVQVRATDADGDSSGWSPPLMVTIASPENPWKDNDNGTLFVDRTWDYTMGYRFSSEVDGTVTELGGRFNGEKVISLWNDQGMLLGSVTVDASQGWKYVSLAEPVQVMAGETYRVGMYSAGSGVVYARYIQTLPITYGSVTILSTCYEYGDGFPTEEATGYMFGQVDVEFVPGG